MFGIGVGAMALVVVLSAFNGIEKLVEGLYSSFDPDVRVEAKLGKTFKWEDFPADKIQELDEVKLISRAIEETVFLKYRDAQYFARLKGVDATYYQMTALDSMLFDGKLEAKGKSNNYAVLGYGVADQLNVFLSHAFEPLKVYAAKRNAKVNNLQSGFNTDVVFPAAIFTINPEYDYKYVLTPYSFASNLFVKPGEVTSAEIALKEGWKEEDAEPIKAILGDDYTVKTRYQLNELLYQTNRTEKWATFLILSFILVIAAFNLIGSITVLVIDKRKDVFVLQAMGASIKFVQRLFFYEGMLISCVGGGIGILVGGLLCLLQKHVGLLKLQEGTVAEYYPIELEFLDFAAVALLVVVIGAVASLLPAKFVVKRYQIIK